MKKIFLFTSLFISILAKSQNAEILFKEKYSKVGLELGLNKMYTKNTPNPASFEWTPTTSFSFGLTYNFYQQKNYNFKVSALYSMFDKNSQFIITDNKGNKWRSAGSDGPYNLFMFPLEAEYYFKIANKTYFSISPGLEVTFNPYGRDEGYSLDAGGIGGGAIVKVETIEYSRNSPWYFGLNLGAAISLSTKPMLIKFNAKYHYQFEDYIYEGMATTTIDGNTSSSKHQLTGNYLGFGISIIPNKKLFK